MGTHGVGCTGSTLDLHISPTRPDTTHMTPPITLSTVTNCDARQTQVWIETRALRVRVASDVDGSALSVSLHTRCASLCVRMSYELGALSALCFARRLWRRQH